MKLEQLFKLRDKFLSKINKLFVDNTKVDWTVEIKVWEDKSYQLSAFHVLNNSARLTVMLEPNNLDFDKLKWGIARGDKNSKM